MSKLSNDLQAALAANEGRIPFTFLQTQVAEATVTYLHPTPNMRLCIIKLAETGHEVLGMAQVLDAANDVEKLGNQVAYDNAVNELWKVFGSIALSLN